MLFFFILSLTLLEARIRAACILDTTVTGTAIPTNNLQTNFIAWSNNATTNLTLSNTQTFYLKYKPYNENKKKKQKTASLVTVTPYYQQSAAASAIAETITPNGQSSFTVKEDGSGDTGSLWLSTLSKKQAAIAVTTSSSDQVYTFYSSKICLAPKTSQLGVLIVYNQDLSKIMQSLWFQAKIGVLQTKNNLHAQEQIESPLGTIEGAQTALEYLSSDAFKAGRFSRKSYSQGWISPTSIMLGGNIVHGKKFQSDIYVSGLTPNGKKENPTYYFAPLVGNGNHAGLGAGINNRWTVFEKADHKISLLNDINYHYFFAETEFRSFDLKHNGPWSRYLQASFEKNTFATAPLINYLTLPVKVTSRGLAEGWTALHYEKGRFQIELVYDLSWKQQEHIAFTKKTQLQDGIGIADITGYTQKNKTPTSARKATISQGVLADNAAPSDNTFIPLTLADIDLHSARGNSIFTNQLAASYGYMIKKKNNEAKRKFFAVMGSYQFKSKSNPIGQWAASANITLSY
jgi:hypothetical protein